MGKGIYSRLFAHNRVLFNPHTLLDNLQVTSYFASDRYLQQRPRFCRLAMSLSGHEDTPSTLRAPITIRLLDTIVRQLPSSQLQLGDQNLERARDIAVEFESVIGQNDRSIIEERITL